jgi:hypothetical protein
MMRARQKFQTKSQTESLFHLRYPPADKGCCPDFCQVLCLRPLEIFFLKTCRVCALKNSQFGPLARPLRFHPQLNFKLITGYVNHEC